MSVTLHLGDCLDILPTLESGSVDAVICDPPYAEVDREYGRLTEAEWHALMRPVVAECRRILKPHGSAVFVLQPSYEGLGRVRPWLWEFMAEQARTWNMVQDVWWWNFTALPSAQAIQGRLCRPSLKACVWLGPSDCYRDQDAVLWEESQCNASERLSRRMKHERVTYPSGHGRNSARITAAAVRRGGVIPFNVLPIANTNSTDSAGSNGHGAGTPAPLANWWIRYITRPGDVVCDPCMGSGTMGIAALKLDRSFLGIEKHKPYFRIAERRIAREREQAKLFI